MALWQLARLGAQLIVARAVEEGFDAFMGRARYERRAVALPGRRSGWRPRHLQTTAGELEIEIPQLCEAAETFASKLLERDSKRVLRAEPLTALVVGAFVRGLSMPDVESLCVEAGPRRVSAWTASRIRHLPGAPRALPSVQGARPLPDRVRRAVPRGPSQ